MGLFGKKKRKTHRGGQAAAQQNSLPQAENRAVSSRKKRRRKRHKSNRILYYILVLFILLVVGVALSLTVFFKITAISVKGVSKYPVSAVQQLTGITDEMVAREPTIETLLPLFLDFAGDLPLIAHNAPFDCGFLFREAEALGLAIRNPVVDTLRLARKVFPRLPSYKLGYLTDYFCIAQEDAHRACCDAAATAKLYLMMRTDAAR